MRYFVDGWEVQSEKAALSHRQPAKYVLQWISALPSSASVLDYGCGRLRYTLPLSQQVKHVVAVDSAHQLERVYTFDGAKRTIVEQAKIAGHHVRVFSTKSLEWRQLRFDFILCVNVLSSIPSDPIRNEMLSDLTAVAKSGTVLLVSTQYRNTYFKGYNSNPRATKYHDGWLIRSRSTAATGAFYGLIDPERLSQYVERAGWCGVDRYTVGESAYVEAHRCHP